MKVVQRLIEYRNLWEDYRKNRNKIEDKIFMRKQQIIRLEKKMDKLRESYDLGYSALFKIIAEDLLPFFPGLKYEVLGPFGLNSHTSIWIIDLDEKIKLKKEGSHSLDYIKYSITFRPAEKTLSILDHKNAPPLPENWTQSIYYLNNSHVPVIDVSDWELKDLVEWMISNSE